MSAAGWYTDPQNALAIRWWDGARWTEHVHAKEAPATGALAHAATLSGPASTHGAVAEAYKTAQVRELDAAIAERRRELESVEEALEIQSFGFYRPRYGFESSDEYAAKLAEIRDDQKFMIKAGEATFCDTKWVVGGSEAEGRKMIGRLAKLMVRAFNGECDAAIAKTRYDNVKTLLERITKSVEEINKLGHSNRVMITKAYFDLKLAELSLVHEHREKLQAEKEEQRQIREQMREEEKALAEIERAKADAERDEEKNNRALTKAREDLAEAAAKALAADADGKESSKVRTQMEKLEGLVTRLETELKGALDRKAKAIARAQLTRSGHVYVLSNLGSFGDGIYKIGMTRRLDPYERVDELGDASVPFAFDVHAIIFSENAPALEHALHVEFASRRVNMVNHRKEYFRVTLDDIRAVVEKLHGLVSFVLTPEAEEWRKTTALVKAFTTEAP